MNLQNTVTKLSQENNKLKLSIVNEVKDIKVENDEQKTEDINICAERMSSNPIEQTPVEEEWNRINDDFDIVGVYSNNKGLLMLTGYLENPETEKYQNIKVIIDDNGMYQYNEDDLIELFFKAA